MSPKRPVVVVSGMVAGTPWQGGATWAVLQYVLGARLLGCEVYLVEEMQDISAGNDLESSAQLQYFRQVCRQFGLERSATLRSARSHETEGMSQEGLRRVAGKTDLLINIAGTWPLVDGFQEIPIRLYLDLDPGFTQVWNKQGIDMRFEGHTHFATVGLDVGSNEERIPTCGRAWIATLQPVALKYWPVDFEQPRLGFTTVANWRGYGSVEYDGLHYGQKVHSWREFIGLPKLSAEHFAVALAIHSGEKRDIAALNENGWLLVDPSQAAGTPDDYQRFIQTSKAEIGIAKSGYVISESGWFSDRSVCYLASGRPVLAQDTGYSRFLPTGEGLLAFSTLEEALEGIDSLSADYARHCREGRSIAEEYFSSDKVLRSLMAKVGIDI